MIEFGILFVASVSLAFGVSYKKGRDRGYIDHGRKVQLKWENKKAS